MTGEIVADDSGLEVDYLDGAQEFIPPDLQERMQVMKIKIINYWNF